MGAENAEPIRFHSKYNGLKISSGIDIHRVLADGFQRSVLRVGHLRAELLNSFFYIAHVFSRSCLPVCGRLPIRLLKF